MIGHLGVLRGILGCQAKHSSWCFVPRNTGILPLLEFVEQSTVLGACGLVHQVDKICSARLDLI